MGDSCLPQAPASASADLATAPVRAKAGRALADAFRDKERADVLCYLARRLANHEAVFASETGFHVEARERSRELSLIVGDIGAGMHEGLSDLPTAAAQRAVLQRIEGARICAQQLAEDQAASAVMLAGEHADRMFYTGALIGAGAVTVLGIVAVLIGWVI